MVHVLRWIPFWGSTYHQPLHCVRMLALNLTLIITLFFSLESPPISCRSEWLVLQALFVYLKQGIDDTSVDTAFGNSSLQNVK